MYEYGGDLFSCLHCTTTTATDFPDFLGYVSSETTHPMYTSPITPYQPYSSGLVQTELVEFDSTIGAMKSEVDYNSSSSYGSPSSLPSYAQRPNFVQRSMSSHSLHNNKDTYYYHPTFSSLDESHHHELLDLDNHSSIRKVFSAGDLQASQNMVYQSGRSESPLSNENCTIEGINNKAVRYSAEERKERIERYRNKRNQRNFNKKIKYACRKTLADSRPRIRGRFARNDEIVETSQGQWNHQIGREETDEDIWVHFYDAFAAI